MWVWLLDLDIIDGPTPWIVWALTGALVIAMTARRHAGKQFLTVMLATIPAAALGLVLCWLVDATNVLGIPLPGGVSSWVAVCFGIIAASVACVARKGAWYRLIAALVVVFTLLSTTLGINAAFGLDRNLGDLLEISTLQPAGDLVTPTPAAARDLSRLSEWQAPANMPPKGVVRQLSGADRISSTAGFRPRDAAIYLPPAALVKDPPVLPVMVQMMGLPGSPTPSAIQLAVDAYAAAHEGLGPIVIVADQLGASRENPACADSKTFGGVDTYFNVDIPRWIHAHLNVSSNPVDWTISGYSNGGACAFLYGAQHPEIWGAIVSISGEEWPGMEKPGPVLAQVFGGDQGAFDANKPGVVLARNPGKYNSHVAIFTAGADDHTYGPAARRAATAAEAAGLTTTFELVPGAGHVGPALSGGLAIALKVLGHHWGMTK